MPLYPVRTLAALAALCFTPLAAQAHDDPTHAVAESITTAAERFLSSLSKPVRAKATLPFDEEVRSDWIYVPGARRGAVLKELDEKQRDLAHALLRESLSTVGYGKATDIVSLEKVLFEIEGAARRDPGLYYVMVFGAPSLKKPWGWRFEGHHLSLSFTIADGAVISTAPNFWGANPAEIRQGERQGHRALAREEDLARALVKSLGPAQRKAAVFADSALNEIVTRADASVSPLKPVGIQVSELDDSQVAILVSLIREYIGNMPTAVARHRMERIEKEGLGAIRFGWAGGIDKGEQHYYRLQGPSFLVEYTNFQGDGNHIHAVWRDFNGDFGRDYLREHFADHAH